MKFIAGIFLFIVFLLVRSGNNHELLLESLSPTISFMENYFSPNANHSINSSQQHSYKTSSLPENSDSYLCIIDDVIEDFQAMQNMYLQMALFAGILCFTYLFYEKLFNKQFHAINPVLKPGQPLFIMQRSLRI